MSPPTDLDAPCIDVRTVAPPTRHPLIFGAFDLLAPGESMDLVNDHDPLPLYFQFERSRTGQFEWRYLQTGPSLWRVRISRVASELATGLVAVRPDDMDVGCQCSRTERSPNGVQP